jgi:Phage protein Gp138 N-terminal domain
MLQSERYDDPVHSFDAALRGLQASLWTALPGIIQSFNAQTLTCTVQPTIRGLFTTQSGQQFWIPLPVLVDVPVIFTGGGGFVATFPVQMGDEALVVFSSRCIDLWWKNGGVQNQAELRMHDLGDGIAIIGPRSQANLIPNVSTTTAQLRSMDGSTFVEIAGGEVVNVVAPSGINLKGPVTITGNLAVSGTTVGQQEGTFNSIAVSTHIHSSVTSGEGTSGPPVP